MKISVLSESAADEAALMTLASAILGTGTEIVKHHALRQRGWPSVKQVLPAVIKNLHYRTEADILVVVVDSNESRVHARDAHGKWCSMEPGKEKEAPCRLCQVREVVEEEIRKLSIVAGRRPLNTAIGLAVPAIEAWYLSGLKQRVNEAAWISGLQSGTFPYTKNELKLMAYGTQRPSLQLETEKAVEHAGRIAKDLEGLKSRFPTGFGWLFNDIRKSPI